MISFNWYMYHYFQESRDSQRQIVDLEQELGQQSVKIEGLQASTLLENFKENIMNPMNVIKNNSSYNLIWQNQIGRFLKH